MRKFVCDTNSSHALDSTFSSSPASGLPEKLYVPLTFTTLGQATPH